MQINICAVIFLRCGHRCDASTLLLLITLVHRYLCMYSDLYLSSIVSLFLCLSLYTVHIQWGTKKMSPPKLVFSDETHLCSINSNFLWSARYMGVKLHEESKYFIRIFATVSTRPYFAAHLYAESAKPACVHSNLNYHQGTPVPPKWAEIIDLMMFSPAKKTDSKNFSEKRVTFIRKSRKNEKSPWNRAFFDFSWFLNKRNSFFRKVFWNQFFWLD